MEILFGGLVAIVSSIVTQLVMKWIREHGRVYCFVEALSIEMVKNEIDHTNNYFRKKVETLRDAEFIEYYLMVDLYNNSEVPVTLREIRLEFKGNGYRIQKYPRLENETEVVGSDEDNFNKYIYVNLPSKQLIRLTFAGTFYDKEDYDQIINSYLVSLIAKRQNNKKYKARIWKKKNMINPIHILIKIKKYFLQRR